LAGILVRRALDSARSYGWKVKPVCTYVQRFAAANPEYNDMLVAL
jgi:predicted GNAT family acetyltransferase